MQPDDDGCTVTDSHSTREASQGWPEGGGGGGRRFWSRSLGGKRNRFREVQAATVPLCRMGSSTSLWVVGVINKPGKKETDVKMSSVHLTSIHYKKLKHTV